MLAPAFQPTLPLTLTLPLNAADFDETQDHEEVDDETTGHLSREIEKAEQEGHPQGKPGGFLNRMISHGNKKTEDQLAEDNKKAAERQTTAQKDDGVIR